MSDDRIDIGLAFEWVLRLVAPLRVVHERMATAEPIVVFLKRTWSFPLALMLLVNVAATAFAGLNVVENGFVIAGITLANILQLVVAPVVIWGMLKVFRARTDLETVLTCYTPTILFAPLFQTLAVGAYAGQYHIAQMLIANSSDLGEAFVYAVHNMPKIGALMPKPIPIVSPAVATLAEIGSILLTVITCEAIAWYGRNDRLRVYLAVCIATALAGIPQTLFHFAEIALTAKIAGLPGR